jgi:hypothetical protein
MSVEVRPAALLDGVAVLSLLEDVATTPSRVPPRRSEDYLIRTSWCGWPAGAHVGSPPSLRYQPASAAAACLDNFAVVKDAPGVEAPRRRLGRASAPVRVNEVNQNTSAPGGAAARAATR